MELTKSFVINCRSVRLLRDFLCQAIDQVDEKDKEIARQKRKRCLKLAELCCERKENCYNIALRKYTKSEGDKLVKKSERWEEWEDCWIQLAAKFKEA